jgi:hypothetical protein
LLLALLYVGALACVVAAVVFLFPLFYVSVLCLGVWVFFGVGFLGFSWCVGGAAWVVLVLGG